ncbi:MAG: hypothetical protein F6K30_16110 [Cyanothece sp. SIO2G6]|nr:hypothetical protein [Cyanothece sp. SIO2G6]
MTITPKGGCPCLDGDENIIPWYNSACEGKNLNSIGDSIELKLEDSPGASNVTAQAKDADGTTKTIKLLEFVEEFLVTLYDTTCTRKEKQWTWKYQFKLEKNENGSIYAKPKVTENVTTPMNEKDPIVDIVIVEPVATDDPQTTWSPDGWGPS